MDATIRPPAVAGAFYPGTKGELERAESALRKAQALDPSDPEIPYNLAAVAWRQGNFARAVNRNCRTSFLTLSHWA